ncbi:hypothetical protein SCHPADRAFT_1003332, partial [Schizopora paradoxa]
MPGHNLHLISPYGLTLIYVSAFLLFLVASIARPSHFFYLFSIQTSDASYKFGPWGYCKVLSSYATCSNSLGWTFKQIPELVAAANTIQSSLSGAQKVLHAFATIILCSAFLIFYTASVIPLGQYRSNGMLHKLILPATSVVAVLAAWIVTCLDEYINAKVKSSIQKQANMTFEAGQMIYLLFAVDIVLTTSIAIWIYDFKKSKSLLLQTSDSKTRESQNAAASHVSNQSELSNIPNNGQITTSQGAGGLQYQHQQFNGNGFPPNMAEVQNAQATAGAGQQGQSNGLPLSTVPTAFNSSNQQQQFQSAEEPVIDQMHSQQEDPDSNVFTPLQTSKAYGNPNLGQQSILAGEPFHPPSSSSHLHQEYTPIQNPNPNSFIPTQSSVPSENPDLPSAPIQNGTPLGNAAQHHLDHSMVDDLGSIPTGNPLRDEAHHNQEVTSMPGMPQSVLNYPEQQSQGLSLTSLLRSPLTGSSVTNPAQDHSFNADEHPFGHAISQDIPVHHPQENSGGSSLSFVQSNSGNPFQSVQQEQQFQTVPTGSAQVSPNSELETPLHQHQANLGEVSYGASPSSMHSYGIAQHPQENAEGLPPSSGHYGSHLGDFAQSQQQYADSPVSGTTVIPVEEPIQQHQDSQNSNAYGPGLPIHYPVQQQQQQHLETLTEEATEHDPSHIQSDHHVLEQQGDLYGAQVVPTSSAIPIANGQQYHGSLEDASAGQGLPGVPLQEHMQVRQENTGEDTIGQSVPAMMSSDLSLHPHEISYGAGPGVSGIPSGSSSQQQQNENNVFPYVPAVPGTPLEALSQRQENISGIGAAASGTSFVPAQQHQGSSNALSTVFGGSETHHQNDVNNESLVHGPVAPLTGFENQEYPYMFGEPPEHPVQQTQQNGSSASIQEFQRSPNAFGELSADHEQQHMENIGNIPLDSGLANTSLASSGQEYQEGPNSLGVPLGNPVQESVSNLPFNSVEYQQIPGAQGMSLGNSVGSSSPGSGLPCSPLAGPGTEYESLGTHFVPVENLAQQHQVNAGVPLLGFGQSGAPLPVSNANALGMLPGDPAQESAANPPFDNMQQQQIPGTQNMSLGNNVGNIPPGSGLSGSPPVGFGQEHESPRAHFAPLEDPAQHQVNTGAPPLGFGQSGLPITGSTLQQQAILNSLGEPLSNPEQESVVNLPFDNMQHQQIPGEQGIPVGNNVANATPGPGLPGSPFIGFGHENQSPEAHFVPVEDHAQQHQVNAGDPLLGFDQSGVPLTGSGQEHQANPNPLGVLLGNPIQESAVRPPLGNMQHQQIPGEQGIPIGNNVANATSGPGLPGSPFIGFGHENQSPEAHSVSLPLEDPAQQHQVNVGDPPLGFGPSGAPLPVSNPAQESVANSPFDMQHQQIPGEQGIPVGNNVGNATPSPSFIGFGHEYESPEAHSAPLENPALQHQVNAGAPPCPAPSGMAVTDPALQHQGIPGELGISQDMPQSGSPQEQNLGGMLPSSMPPSMMQQQETPPGPIPPNIPSDGPPQEQDLGGMLPSSMPPSMLQQQETPPGPMPPSIPSGGPPQEQNLGGIPPGPIPPNIPSNGLPQEQNLGGIPPGPMPPSILSGGPPQEQNL